MRPSYVLGGQNMIVAYTKADVIEYMGVITEHVDMDHPVLLDKYILGTECEVDAICDGENFLIPGIMEQVERTGVHRQGLRHRGQSPFLPYRSVHLQGHRRAHGRSGCPLLPG